MVEIQSITQKKNEKNKKIQKNPQTHYQNMLYLKAVYNFTK